MIILITDSDDIYDIYDIPLKKLEDITDKISTILILIIYYKEVIQHMNIKKLVM